MDILEDNSLRKYEIDWASLRGKVHNEAGNLKVPSDAYPAIRHALRLIGEKHSFLLMPDEVARRETCVNRDPLIRVAENFPDAQRPVGYVRVEPAVCQGNDELATAYHRGIERVDTAGVCGWVVDLRGNTGGSMGPMIAGVGPILGEGVLGYFVGPDSTRSWAYQDGSLLIGENVSTTVDSPYTLAEPMPHVVVLVDGRTASAAEATYLSFVGRPKTRRIGEKTAGYSTANRGFLLSDGAVLAVTTSLMADRTLHTYGGRIFPHRFSGGNRTLDPDQDYSYGLALQWLAEHASCAEG